MAMSVLSKVWKDKNYGPVVGMHRRRYVLEFSPSVKFPIDYYPAIRKFINKKIDKRKFNMNDYSLISIENFIDEKAMKNFEKNRELVWSAE